ncbi:uncharacterized protein [Gossypium hirsutum]|uniref:RNase H type-1 domain-containing protein n=1 Tax=Gossypium hirsutum TaxID=3635 RepID=A0A1U8JW27_GOSHI|nr:uncharacterized protein LOC107911069 [Gossypium hirsutum]
MDPLKYMMESTALNRRMVRSQILLFKFDIVYINQKVVKGSPIADFLASRALENYEPLDFDFPNEDLIYVATIEEDAQEGYPWKLNFDGASNTMAKECKIKVLEVYGDFALVIISSRVNGKLIEYRRLVIELIKEFDYITFCYLPRDKNQMADVLATLASMVKMNKYEDNREYPNQAAENDKRTLRKLASDYVLDGEILYKRTKNQGIDVIRPISPKASNGH